jgi:hypothetical protein
MFSVGLLLPAVDKYTFVYHEKSVTVKAAHYISGSNNETRNDISLYHPELQHRSEGSVPVAVFPRTYPDLYEDYDNLTPHSPVEVYPVARDRPVMCIVYEGGEYGRDVFAEVIIITAISYY